MINTSLGKILKKYSTGWISVSQDHKSVLAWGKTLKSMLKKLEKKGNPEGYVMKVAKTYSNYIGI